MKFTRASVFASLSFAAIIGIFIFFAFIYNRHLPPSTPPSPTTPPPVASPPVSLAEIFEMGTARDVEKLIGAASDQEEVIKYIAIDALGKIGDVRAAESLIQSMRDKSEYIRECTAHALGVLKYEGAVKTLTQALRDNSILVRQTAAWALAQTGHLEEAMIEVTNAKKSPEEEIASRLFFGVIASKLAITSSEHSSTALLRITPSPSMVQQWVERESRDKVSEILARILMDQSNLSAIRVAAAHSLGIIKAKESVKPLLNVVRDDTNWSVRLKSLVVLGFIGDKEAVDPLIDILNTMEDLQLRSNVANTLGYLGDGRAVGPLIHALVSPEYIAHRAIGPSIFDYQGRKQWEKQIKELQISAATALGRIGDRKAIDILKIFASNTFRDEIAKTRSSKQVPNDLDLAISASHEADNEVRKAAENALKLLTDR